MLLDPVDYNFAADMFFFLKQDLLLGDAIDRLDKAQEELDEYIADNDIGILDPDEDEYEANGGDAASMPASVATPASAVTPKALRESFRNANPEPNICCDICSVWFDSDYEPDLVGVPVEVYGDEGFVLGTWLQCLTGVLTRGVRRIQ